MSSDEEDTDDPGGWKLRSAQQQKRHDMIDELRQHLDSGMLDEATAANVRPPRA